MVQKELFGRNRLRYWNRMAKKGAKWSVLRSVAVISLSFLLSSMLASAERGLKQQSSTRTPSKASRPDYKHVWPEMMFGWRIVTGTIVGFIGAACGSVGGVGGGGIFVPMLSLIIGFDVKSAIAMSKCMIMGAAGSTVSYNLRLRHPTLDMPIIDYDLALLIQPMLMLGISIGVGLNVIFADWMVTVLLIFLFIGTSTKAFLKGIETWKKETIMKKMTEKREQTCRPFPGGGPSNGTEMQTKNSAETTKAIVVISDDGQDGANRPFPGGPSNGTATQTKNSAETTVVISDDGQDGANRPFPGGPSNGTATQTKNSEEPKKVSIVKNVRWKELGLLVIVWVVFLVLQITKKHTATCSVVYWALNLLQIPVSVGVSLYEAIRLYQGRKVIASIGDRGTKLKERQLALYCFCGVLAGMVGGLLGLGGGFILTPLFLELGVPPQVASATATFAMFFSSSMSVVEYYLLKRFPVPYALYFLGVAAISAFIGQHVVTKVINFLGRASLIIFVLAATIFASAISLGGDGILNMVKKIERHEYMGLENLCKYGA